MYRMNAKQRLVDLRSAPALLGESVSLGAKWADSEDGMVGGWGLAGREEIMG